MPDIEPWLSRSKDSLKYVAITPYAASGLGCLQRGGRVVAEFAEFVSVFS